MSYATAAELRTRFKVGLDRDEFALRDDADLEQALAAATAEIDSWRPAGALSDAATAILRDRCLILARLVAHQDQALDDAHPIVRDAREVRAWLRALAAGTVGLPAGTDTAGGTGADWHSTPTVWTRGSGGGL